MAVELLQGLKMNSVVYCVEGFVYSRSRTRRDGSIAVRYLEYQRTHCKGICLVDGDIYIYKQRHNPGAEPRFIAKLCFITNLKESVVEHPDRVIRDIYDGIGQNFDAGSLTMVPLAVIRITLQRIGQRELEKARKPKCIIRYDTIGEDRYVCVPCGRRCNKNKNNSPVSCL